MVVVLGLNCSDYVTDLYGSRPLHTAFSPRPRGIPVSASPVDPTRVTQGVNSLRKESPWLVVMKDQKLGIILIPPLCTAMLLVALAITIGALPLIGSYYSWQHLVYALSAPDYSIDYDCKGVKCYECQTPS